MFAEKLKHHETMQDSRNEQAYYCACLEFEAFQRKYFNMAIDIPPAYYGTSTREKDLAFRVAGFPDGNLVSVNGCSVWLPLTCLLCGREKAGEA
jgi:hypothetical protein